MKHQRLTAMTFASLTSLLVLASFISPAAHASPGSDDHASDQPVSTNAPAIHSSRSSNQDIDSVGYWTEEKMRSALPAEEIAPELEQSGEPQPTERSSETKIGESLTHPAYPKSPPGQQTRNAVVPTTTGKVFFSYKGKDYVCSGATINGPTKDVVSTAGHCVHGGKGEGWHTNIAFAPGYYNGVSHNGLWHWKSAHTLRGWIDSSDFSRDQAFFTVHPRDGRTLVDTVGGNGFYYNYGHDQTGVRIWGWPAEPPYQGHIPYYCDGNTRKRNWLSSDMVMPCDMTGGASGGPWLKSQIDANLGYVFGVTSRRTTSGEKLLISTPFNDAVVNLFRSIG